MPQIPTMQQPAPRQTPGMPRVSTGAASAEGAAGERLGAIVSGAAGELTAFYQRKAEAVNWASELAVQNKQREVFENFQRSLADPDNPSNSADPQDQKTGYVARLTEAHAQFDEWLTSQNLPPAVMEKVGPLSSSWKQQTNAAVKNQLVQAQVSKAIGDYGAARQNDLRDGDFVRANARTADAERLGLISPEQAAKDRSQAPSEAQRYEALALINADPIAAERALDDKESFTRLNSETRLSLAYNASTAANRVRSDNADALFAKRQAFLAGEGPDVSPEEARAMEADGRLSRGAATAYLKPPKAEFDPVEFAALYNRISSYDKNSDPTSIEYSILMGEASKYKAETGLIGILTAKAKDPKSVENSPVAAAGNKIIAENFEAATKPSKWVPRNVTTGEPGRLVTPPAIEVAAQEARARVQTLFWEWLKKNPDATPEEAQKFIYQAGRSSARAATMPSRANATPKSK